MSKKIILEHGEEAGQEVTIGIPEYYDMINVGDIIGGCARIFVRKDEGGILRIGGEIEHSAWSEVEIQFRFDKEQLVVDVQTGPNSERTPYVRIGKTLEYAVVKDREL